MTPEQLRSIFAHNFNELLTINDAPPTGYGRIRHVSDKFGISVSSAGRWLLGAAAPESHRFCEISNVLGVTVDQLISKKLSPKDIHHIRTSRLSRKEGKFDVSLDSALISLLSSVGAPQHITKVSEVFPLSSKYPAKDTMYWLKITSKTMEPFVVPGDFVVFIPVGHFTHEGEYVLWVDDRFCVRRVSKSVGGDTLRLFPENDRYPVEDVEISRLQSGDPSALHAPEEGTSSIQGIVVARILINR